MISDNTISPPSIQVGLMNIEMALNVLHSFGMQPKSNDTGGKLGRRLLFDTTTGDVWKKN